MREHQYTKRKVNTLFAGLLFLLILINLVLFIKILSPKGHYDLTRVVTPQAAYYVEERDVASAGAVPGTNSEEITPIEQKNNYSVVLDWRLAGTKVDGSYKLETYQEFEIYRNVQGQIVKTIPTQHYNYLRYWIYE